MAMPGVAALRSGKKPTDNIQGVKVKEEKPEDAEINEIAAKIVEQNRAKMAAAAVAAAASSNAQQARLNQNHASGSSSGGILSYLQKSNPKQQPPIAPPSPQAEKPPLDSASQKGKFGWVILGGEHIPFIQRGDEKYCAVRMVEMKLLLKYLNFLNSDIYSCTCIRSYYITEAEAKLLTEINLKHCEARFGREHFTTKDLVVMLNDASEFYEFLDLCYTKLLNPMSSNTKERCGFVRINKDSVVPYTIKDGEKYVPLFYFEGETEALLKKAATLGPWHLAYLKFCCKIQGIRNELFSSDSCHVISLADIRSYFPPGTVFDEYWPPKIQSSQLFAPKNNGPRTNQLSWIQAPGTPTSTSANSQVVKDTSLDPPRMTPQVTMANNGWHSGAQAQSRYQQAALTPSTRIQPPSQMINTSARNNAMRQSSRSQYLSPAHFGDLPSCVSAANTHSTMTAASQQDAVLRGSTNPIASRTYSNPNLNSAISHANSMQQIMNNAIIPSPHMQFSPQHNNNNNNNGQKQPPPLIPVNGNTHRYFRPELVDLSSPPHSPHRTTIDKAMEDKYKIYENSRAALGRAANNKALPQAPNNFSNFYQPYASYELMSQQKKPPEPKKDPVRQKMENEGWHKLIPIIETPARGGNLLLAFKMQKALVGDKMVPCINAKPHAYSELLMTVRDLMEQFFPDVSLEKCQEVLQNVLQVNLYAANTQMKTVLFEHKKLKSVAELVPLIQLKDVMQYFPQLRYVMEGGSDNPAKRPRISQS